MPWITRASCRPANARASAGEPAVDDGDPLLRLQLDLALSLEEMRGIQRGHASHARACHSLTIDVIGQVARREHAGDRGARAACLDLDVTAVVQL